MPISADFQPHFRKSPVTDPWEPLFSRRRTDGVDLQFEVRAAHCNSRGILHGGVVAALCDNAMGLSLAASRSDQRVNIVTVNLAVDYAGSAKVGDTVLIEPRIIKSGSSLGVCDVLVKCAEHIIARGNATFSLRAAAPVS